MLFSSVVFTSTQFHKYDANHVGNLENDDNDDDDRDDDDVEDDDNDDNDGDADDALFPPAATCEKKERLEVSRTFAAEQTSRKNCTQIIDKNKSGISNRVSQKNQKSEFWNVPYPSGFHWLDEPPEKNSAL